MKRAALVLSLVAATLAVAPTPAEAGALVVEAPPAPRLEFRPAQPGPDHLWIAGHWRWDGSSHVWVAGSWAIRPAPGAVWVYGRWVRRTEGWEWAPGHWRPGAALRVE